MSLLVVVVVSCIWPILLQRKNLYYECSSMSVGCTLFLTKPGLAFVT